MLTLTRRLAALLLVLPMSAIAESDAPIDEIVVSADYRGRTAADIPGSVSVFTAAELEASTVQHFEELIHRVPNLNWSGDGHRPRYLQIRGVGELEQYQGAPNPSVGFLVDDIDFSGIGGIATLFDIAAVEVLRGPQGSRYGANALGGLVYLRSAEPRAEPGGRLQVTAAGDNTGAVGVAWGGAVSRGESLTARASLHHHSGDGFRYNRFLGRSDSNGRDETSLRVKLRFAPDDGFSAQLATMLVDVDNGYDAFALDNGFHVLSDKPGRDAQRSIGSSLRLDWQRPGDAQLTAITSLAGSDIDFDFDADWGNDESWAPFVYDYTSRSDRDRRTASQEIRWSSGNWLAGVYALRLEDRLTTFNDGRYLDPGSGFSDDLAEVFDSDFAATSLALFTQVEQALGPAATLTAGLRVERRWSRYGDSAGLSLSPAATLWGGEIGIARSFERGSVYATLGRGYKAGGFNLGALPEARRRFGDEAMWTLETGAKTSFADGRLRLVAALFHAWRREQQVRASFQLLAGDPASFRFATVNVESARNYGAEFDLSWLADERLELFLGGGLLFGDFGSVPEFPWLEGREQAHAPNFSVSAGAEFRHEDGFFLRLDVSARDAFYFDVSHDRRSDAYALINLRAGLDRDAWRLSVWARNLGDRYYAVRGFYFGNEPPDFLPALYTRAGDPRQLGATFEWRF